MPAATRKSPAKPRKAKAPPAHAVVDFINAELKHTGDYIGEPFALRPWQEEIVRRMFDPAGHALYETVFIGIPRKNGKTELIAAILLYLMFGTGKKGQRIFSASGDHKQAALVHCAAASMVRQSDALSSCSQVFDSYKEIRCDPLESMYAALSSEAKNQYGLRPSVVVFDEFWVLPNRQLYTALTSGFGATKKPLVIIISTAGWDRTSLCWEQWQYARGVRDGLIEDPDFLPILWETDPAADWTDEAVWHQAMPALGDFCQLKFIRKECEKAKKLPAYENTFRQLYLNQWTEQALRWISVERWKLCGGYYPAESLLGRPCYGGLDLGITGDMACLALLFPPTDDDPKYRLILHGWVPRDGRWRDEFRNQDRYLQWERDGYLTFTEGEALDDQVIEDALAGTEGKPGLADKYPLRQLDADRAYATSLLLRLFNRAGLNVKGIAQGPVTLNEPMVLFEEMILNGRIAHGDNPILDWNIANASIRRTSTNLMYLDRASATERIDGLAALIDALAAMVAVPGDSGPSVYESRGLLVLTAGEN